MSAVDVPRIAAPRSAASVSASVVFRVIAAHAPTFLIDEADTIFGEGDDTLRGILNAGHRRDATVLRAVGDEFEPRAFNCYGACAIALIGQLPGTLSGIRDIFNERKGDKISSAILVHELIRSCRDLG